MEERYERFISREQYRAGRGALAEQYDRFVAGERDYKLPWGLEGWGDWGARDAWEMFRDTVELRDTESYRNYAEGLPERPRQGSGVAESPRLDSGKATKAQKPAREVIVPPPARVVEKTDVSELERGGGSDGKKLGSPRKDLGADDGAADDLAADVERPRGLKRGFLPEHDGRGIVGGATGKAKRKREKERERRAKRLAEAEQDTAPDHPPPADGT